MQPDGENFEGTMILECPKCHLKWMERTQLPMSIEAFIAIDNYPIGIKTIF